MVVLGLVCDLLAFLFLLVVEEEVRVVAGLDFLMGGGVCVCLCVDIKVSGWVMERRLRYKWYIRGGLDSPFDCCSWRGPGLATLATG